MTETKAPDLTYLSLGAGVQSTALTLLAANGDLPKPDLAIFADTGWEPRSVYDHLDRLDREVLQPAGIPLIRVENGNIRDESLDDAYSVHLPLFIKSNTSGKAGTIRRQCTANYKLVPIFRKVRELLGGKVAERECTYCEGKGERVAPWTIKRGDPKVGQCSVCHGKGAVIRVGQPPKGSMAHQWVGFSTDEITRVAPARVPYLTSLFPLLDLNMSRSDCGRYLTRKGWGSTAKSACIGCPFHGNAEWREIRDNDPESWADAVHVDREVRRVPGASSLTGEGFLHRSLLPLDQAPIDKVSRRENAALQLDMLDLLAEKDWEAEQAELENGSSTGCSPYGCRSGDPIEMPAELLGDDVDDADGIVDLGMPKLVTV